jgi:REP element-mobilizing transposase RayT
MTLLEPDKFYHIYNRANGNEKVFANSGNYEFFLQKYQQHITPVAETYCYCLMPNHFHILIKIKSAEDFHDFKSSNSEKIGLYCSKKFSNLFSSYSQAFNKQQNRMGSLFMKNFKRKEINSENYLHQLIYYIHNNPVASNLVEEPREWKHSSYNTLLSDNPTFLLRKEVLDLYDGIENFKIVHSRPTFYDSPF